MKKFLLLSVTAAMLFVFSSRAIAAETPAKESFDPEASETLGQDHGNSPWVVDIEEITMENQNFRAAKWTGKYIQMTLMSIPAGGEIGGEVHHFTDQFIRVESGRGRIMMGAGADNVTFNEEVSADWVLFIPAGYWHNLYNTGEEDLKLYSIYGPPQHLPGTVHKTSAEAKEGHHD